MIGLLALSPELIPGTSDHLPSDGRGQLGGARGNAGDRRQLGLSASSRWDSRSVRVLEFPGQVMRQPLGLKSLVPGLIVA